MTESPLRIVMVGPFGFHPNKTMRSRALRLAAALAAREHQVTLVMPPWQTPEEAGRRWEEQGVSIRYVHLGGGVPGTVRRMLRETAACRPDVVHCFKPKAYSGFAAWWLWQTRRRGPHLVVDTDDWEGWGGWNDRAPYSTMQKHLFAWQERWGLRHCHLVTVASRALEGLVWAYGAPAERVLYLPNGPGIDADTAGADLRRADLGLADRPVVLLYSRLFEFDTTRLVAVLKRVRDALPRLAILAVGAGLYADEAAALREHLQRHNLLDCFVDTGWLDEEALPATLAAADVGLYLMDDTLLNRTKCPVKLADMAAVGVPVVAERVGQVSEYILPQESGLLFPTAAVDDIAAGVVRLLQDPDCRVRYGQRARAHMAHTFAWAGLGARLEQAYRAL